ncbi:hypothetical protein TNIN_24061 [Trichonephila inaurata madagascariensis]|uniref:Uncharacterized protein n=1 Tax=Trichonephila inaurata madagascariensis TaxID=2747483 RepID=A0A8X7CF23_9ARAC|nr:hypothetical protein TNIN_24061 [Trichonephila inaurata madagascariensis]
MDVSKHFLSGIVQSILFPPTTNSKNKSDSVPCRCPFLSWGDECLSSPIRVRRNFHLILPPPLVDANGVRQACIYSYIRIMRMAHIVRRSFVLVRTTGCLTGGGHELVSEDSRWSQGVGLEQWCLLSGVGPPLIL